MNKNIDIIVQPEESNIRIDKYLSQKLSDLSRSYLQSLIKSENIKVNNKIIKANYKTKEGDNIVVTVPPPIQTDIKAENINIDIIYQDSDILVINKPQGMVVHPAPGNYSGTLVNALLYRHDCLSNINGEIRPGIVHRIDKDTSGLLVVAKNNTAHIKLSEQLKDKTMNRIYLAVVENNIKQDEGTIDTLIGRNPVDRKKMAVIKNGHGRQAITHYKVLERYGDYTLVRAKLETGRTHQIRVHMAYIGHPIVGDPVYGSKNNKFKLKGQALHAKQLTLIHPTTGKVMVFNAPLPEYFNALLQLLRKRSR